MCARANAVDLRAMGFNKTTARDCNLRLINRRCIIEPDPLLLMAERLSTASSKYLSITNLRSQPVPAKAH